MRINQTVILVITIFFSALLSPIKADTNFFNKGVNFFLDEKFDKAKIEFEKDIVFNPKNEKSYLYLAKIFNKKDNLNLEENNLNTVILLNPRNEEAIYDLTLLNIKKSNFEKSKELINTFKIVCKNLCLKKNELEIKLDSSLK
tara:strand:- start:176 stop:604 length:429 start_codon:yes stop_codon:yes gene_type:complete